MSRIKDIGNDKSIIQEWMVIENNRLKEQGILNTAIEDGIEKGMKKGMKKGADKKTIEVIQKMVNKNIDYITISEVTGKSIEEIEKIKSNLAKVY